MLVELRVRNLAVVRDARLELGAGLNVLTGETGAGKSLLVDALALLIGERADSALVRPDADRCVVEGAFELDGAALAEALGALGLEPEDGRLVVKREIAASGRSRAWINGSPATIGVLAGAGSLLVDLHGQHETQSLLRPEVQRRLLDAYGETEREACAAADAWDELERLRAERADLDRRRAEARRRADYLRHVADEIGRVNPRPGELEALEAEARRLAHAEEIGRTAGQLAELLDGDDRAANAALAHAGRLLAGLERIDAAGTASWREMLESALVNAEELARSVRAYAEAIEADPVRLAEVERRRDLLFGLDRKYGPGIDRIVETGESARRELELLDTAEADLDELARQVETAEAVFGERCRALSAKRRSAARRLSKAVSAHLSALGMPDGRVRVALTELESAGRGGAESVELMCALNPGLPERPVAKAASGGELSRVMLALKVELARHDAIPTLVFDEVDAGVGGPVATRVATALSSVADRHQVLVITHLPQIAAAADRHIVVEKTVAAGETATHVRVAEGTARLVEVARLLGGSTAAARRHAAELLGARTARK